MSHDQLTSRSGVRTIGLVGLEGRVIDVEAELAEGSPSFAVTGLPDPAYQDETRDRVRAAILNSGLAWPQRRITVSLTPAMPPTRGSTVDLAVAVAVLAPSGVIPPAVVDSAAFLGELGLDGQARPVRGVLPAALAAARAGVRTLVVPAANLAEASVLCRDLDVVGVASLAGLLAHLTGNDAGTTPGARSCTWPPPGPVETPALDFADVIGHAHAKQCLEVAAAGGHSMFLLGPTGEHS